MKTRNIPPLLNPLYDSVSRASEPNKVPGIGNTKGLRQQTPELAGAKPLKPKSRDRMRQTTRSR